MSLLTQAGKLGLRGDVGCFMNTSILLVCYRLQYTSDLMDVATGPRRTTCEKSNEREEHHGTANGD